MKAAGAAGAKTPLLPTQTRDNHHKQTAASAAAKTCSIAVWWRWLEKGCLRVLCRNTARPAYAPMVPPKKRLRQQRPLRHPPRSRLRTDLVKAEQHERPQVDQRKQAKRVGDGEEGVDGHA